jgi:8-hydroxy-5-deazaflavin:NADPH oxidoreductase
MKLAIIGAGHVGGTLGARWARGGHEVVYGVRHPDGERTRTVLAASGPQARAASPAEAAASSEVVVIAIPYGALGDLLPALGDLTGKVVLDAVNNPAVAPGAPAIAAEIAGMLPGARVVKAFNTMGWNVMADPRFGGERADSYICGDDAAAKDLVAALARELGFVVVDAGPLASAGLLEGLALLWIDLALRQGFGRDIAFRLLRR